MCLVETWQQPNVVSMKPVPLATPTSAKPAPLAALVALPCAPGSLCSPIHNLHLPGGDKGVDGG